MIEFLAEWLVTFLIPATHVLEVRAPHLSFMLLKEYWFRELYLGLKVTASFDRSESYTRVVFARAAQNPHTPGGNAAVELCKEAYDSFSPSHTDAALPLGSGAYSTDLLKRQARYFKSLSPW